MQRIVSISAGDTCRLITVAGANYSQGDTPTKNPKTILAMSIVEVFLAWLVDVAR
jgi:hypothetical protein